MAAGCRLVAAVCRLVAAGCRPVGRCVPRQVAPAPGLARHPCSREVWRDGMVVTCRVRVWVGLGWVRVMRLMFLYHFVR